MIIARAPFRVSFAGGFSDAAARERGEEGAILSATVGLFVYVTVHLRKDSDVVAAYSRVEKASSLDGIEHVLFREALSRAGVVSGVEMHSIGELSLSSSGLGGSSAAAVAMVLALSRLRGMRPSARDVAEEAADVEIKGMRRSIGKQDHYAAAYGGLNVFRFRGEGVRVERQDEAQADVLSGCMAMAPCKGGDRDASEMLKEQLAADPGIPRALAALVPDALRAFEECRLLRLCEVVRDGWKLKKRLSPRMSNVAADAAVLAAENLGGGAKLCGAGGTGHVWAVLPHADATAEFVRTVPGAFHVSFEPRGAEIRHDDGERR